MTPAEAVGRVRAAYDALPRGARATLRRCAEVEDLRAEGVYWRLLEDAGVPDEPRLRFTMAYVVACFDAASNGKEGFARWLRRTAYDGVKPGELPARAVRFRRLLAARERDELVHHLRALLGHGFQKSKVGVDWAELGADIFFWGDRVRSRWAEDFFTNVRFGTKTEEMHHE